MFKSSIDLFWSSGMLHGNERSVLSQNNSLFINYWNINLKESIINKLETSHLSVPLLLSTCIRNIYVCIWAICYKDMFLCKV